jgi:HK97 family phage prohead protease
MDYKQLPQAEASTDETGAFVAVVSAFTIDRQGEQIRPGAFSRTLAKWRKSGRMIPVLADHEGSVGNVVGRIDPRLSAETREGLEATGTLDVSTELGRRVYELVKAGTLAWSIGYRVPKGGRRRRGDYTEITEIDLAEVSAVATPANADVRTVSVKAAKAWDGSASRYDDAEYAAASILDRRDCGEGDLPAKQRYSLPVAHPGSSWRKNPDPAGVHAAAARINQVNACPEAIRTAALRLLTAYGVIGEDAPESVRAMAESKALTLESMSDDELRQASLAATKGIETRPLKIASFRC